MLMLRLSIADADGLPGWAAWGAGHGGFVLQELICAGALAARWLCFAKIDGWGRAERLGGFVLHKLMGVGARGIAVALFCAN